MGSAWGKHATDGGVGKEVTAIENVVTEVVIMLKEGIVVVNVMINSDANIEVDFMEVVIEAHPGIATMITAFVVEVVLVVQFITTEAVALLQEESVTTTGMVDEM